jgi:RND superfamily putative drug exporter
MSLDLSTGGLARFSGQRPGVTIAVWAFVLLGALVLNITILGDALTPEFTFSGDPESQHGYDVMREGHRDLQKANEMVIVSSETLTVDAPAFEELATGVYGEIVALGSSVVQDGFHYYQTREDSLVSDDGRTTIMPFVMGGSFADATGNIGGVIEIVERADRSDGFTVLIVGDASIANETKEISQKDLETGEMFAIPVALVILVLVLGALLAATLPVILAAVSIVLALGMTALLGQEMDLSFFVVNMVTMMGLAVGIDYSLFVVARYREERGRGREKLDAIAAAGATASRAVLFSGLTVVLALIGMVIVPTSIFQSLGIGAIFVVISAVLASLTLLPAVLSLMGDRVNSLRVPYVGRGLGPGSSDAEGGFWDWVTGMVMRHPAAFLIVAVGLLLAAAFPVLDIETGSNGISTLPDGLQAKRAFTLLEREFAFGEVSPVYIVIQGQIDSEGVQGAVQRLTDRLRSDTLFRRSLPLEVNDAGDIALLSVPLSAEPASEDAVEAVRKLRERYVPDAFLGEEAEVFVTGITAFNVDFFDITSDYMPIVFAVVLGFSFLLLTVVFRSIIVPIKAIIMNLLSVGAAYGLIVLVFQKGVGVELLGFQQSPVIEAWIPLFLFSVLFGLSMDYHVFLLSRIRERFDQTGDNAGSVAYGLRSTAGIITGAALIMVTVFGGFAAGDLVMFQQVGFGLAVAVFLDATIVRSILVPASMKLLGDLNWYLPSALGWLPDVRVEAPQPMEAGDGGD